MALATITFSVKAPPTPLWTLYLKVIGGFNVKHFFLILISTMLFSSFSGFAVAQSTVVGTPAIHPVDTNNEAYPGVARYCDMPIWGVRKINFNFVANERIWRQLGTNRERLDNLVRQKLAAKRIQIISFADCNQTPDSSAFLQIDLNARHFEDDLTNINVAVTAKKFGKLANDPSTMGLMGVWSQGSVGIAAKKEMENILVNGIADLIDQFFADVAAMDRKLAATKN